MSNRQSSRSTSQDKAVRLKAFAFALVGALGLAGCAGYSSNGSNPSGHGTLSASSATISFGNVAVGASSTQTVSISNTGTVAVAISGATISGGVFTVNGTTPTGSIAAGQSVSVQLQFSPTSITPASGTLTITSDATDSSLAISLSGTGLQAQLSASTTTVNFGGDAIGNSDSQSIVLTNNGNQTLTLSQVNVSGAGFGQTGLSTSTTIAAGGSTTFSATFDPSTAAPASGAITLTTNGAPSSLVINLSGTGQTPNPQLSANPTSLSFNQVLDGDSSQLTTTITNTGNVNATISAITVTGAGFSASGIANGTVLMPGQALALAVTFAPVTGGLVSGAGITIANTATTSPINIGLSGTGMHSVALSWNASSTFGVTYNVYRGASAGGEATTPINTAPVIAQSFTDTNVTAGSSYYYYVEAVDSAGSSTPSNEAMASVPTP